MTDNYYRLKDNYERKGKKTPVKAEALANEIIALRNQYVHSGYYIKNERLRIKLFDSSRKILLKQM